MGSNYSKKIVVFIFIFTFVTTIVYLNHFDNAFHFDDSHTIINNVFIKDVKNIPGFFTDGTTFSSLPQNQSYRPIVSASLAIDYWLCGGLDVFYFHLSTFILFLLQGILMFFLFFKLLNKVYENKYNFFISASAAVWYALHPANAETVNYIIARSEIQSTIGVIMAFVLYMYSPFCRKTFLYLIPVGIGALAKPPAVMFAPLFFFYLVLIEQDMSLLDIFKRTSFPRLLRAIKTAIPAFLFCGMMYFIIHVFTPKSWIPGGTSTFDYAISQPMVIVHYFLTFFYPIGLSADTDWKPIQNMLSVNFIFGMAFVILLLAIASFASKKKEQRPISFGIIWFFISLLPTSSFIPLAEILNDHRLFFPYVGLILSVCWAIGLLFIKLKTRIANAKIIMIILVPLILIAYGFGTYKRNEVWQNDESLWKDVTIKSPKNGRGLMNYGLVKMKDADYAIADEYFNKALEYCPYYPTLYVNLGISCDAQSKKIQAENYFKQAIKYGYEYDYTWYYYGQFLIKERRFPEAIQNLERAFAISTINMNVRILLMDAYYETRDWERLKTMSASTLAIESTNNKAKSYLKACDTKNNKQVNRDDNIPENLTVEEYINLSLTYYQRGFYEKCIAASKKALELNTRYVPAYNNIGAAYIKLGKYNEAIGALKIALEIDPTFQLAKGNLEDARQHANQK